MANRELLQKGNMFMTTAMLLLIDGYGTEALQWDLETIKMELETDYRVKISNDIIDKIAAGIQIITTDRFYTSTPDFIALCNVINDEQGLPNVWDPADAYEVAWALAEVGLLDPPETDWISALNPEILEYIIIVLREEGVITAPPSLKFIASDKLIGPSISALESDPMLYAAAYQEAVDASDTLAQYVNERTYELVEELKQLDLRNGNIQQVVEEMDRNTKPPNRLQV